MIPPAELDFQINGDSLALFNSLSAIVLNVLNRTPRNGANFSLQTSKATILESSAENPHDCRQMPADIRTAFKTFHLEAKLTSYVCCPTCFCLYPEIRPYPDACTYKIFGVKCGTSLIRPPIDGKPRRPVRRFLYQNPIDWLARLLQRPGIEELVDVPRTRETKDVLVDVLDGSFAQNLQGPDGKWFLGRPGRYLFALGIDGYNPNSNRNKKKKKSVGGMYMTLLNLPIHLRHRVENICVVGVIPGPHEPTVENQQINHILDVLVRDLSDFWDPGVRLSSTYCYPGGRDTRAALGLIANDLVGARPVAGFTALTHTILCSCCDCLKSQLYEIDRIGPPRSGEAHKAHGEAWLRATTAKARQALVDENGARYTPFMKLPYTNLAEQVVPDGLHCPMNVVKTQLREYWGLDITEKDNLIGPACAKEWPDRQEYRKAEGIVFTGTQADVDELPLSWAQALAFVRDIPLSRTEPQDVYEKLHAWVSSVDGCFQCILSC